MQSFLKSYIGSGTVNDPRTLEIRESRQARRSFFTEQNKRNFETHLASLTPEEAAKLETMKDKDSIAWFNRTKAAQTNQPTIKGSFYKVRHHGGASENDNREINKFYKRAMASFACLLLHANISL